MPMAWADQIRPAILHDARSMQGIVKAVHTSPSRALACLLPAGSSPRIDAACVYPPVWIDWRGTRWLISWAEALAGFKFCGLHRKCGMQTGDYITVDRSSACTFCDLLRGMSYFQEMLAWRFAGAALWSLAISVAAEVVLATLLSLLSLPGALGMIGLRGLLLLGLQFLVLVRERPWSSAPMSDMPPRGTFTCMNTGCLSSCSFRHGCPVSACPAAARPPARPLLVALPTPHPTPAQLAHFRVLSASEAPPLQLPASAPLRLLLLLPSGPGASSEGPAGWWLPRLLARVVLRGRRPAHLAAVAALYGCTAACCTAYAYLHPLSSLLLRGSGGSFGWSVVCGVAVSACYCTQHLAKCVGQPVSAWCYEGLRGIVRGLAYMGLHGHT